MPNTICQSECALNPELVRSFCIHTHTRTRTIYQPEFALKNKNHTRTQTKGWDLSERAALEHRKVLSTASRANEETTRKDDMERERQSRFLESLHNGDVVENLDLRSEEQFPSLPMSRMKGAVMPTPIATTNQDVQGHGVASALDNLEQPPPLSRTGKRKVQDTVVSTPIAKTRQTVQGQGVALPPTVQLEVNQQKTCARAHTHAHTHTHTKTRAHTPTHTHNIPVRVCSDY